MPRFFYKPVQQETSGYSRLGEQLGAGLQQGVNNYLGVRAKAAEDRIRETEAARQHEREDFADSVMRAQAGIEEGPAPMAGLDIFEGRGVGMQGQGPRKPSPLAMGQAPGAAASLFAAPALETIGSQGGGGMSEREPGLLERYAASGPDADYATFSAGDRQYHMLRPEVKTARERAATQASQFQDYTNRQRFDQTLDDEGEAADHAREMAEFEDRLGPAAAALAARYGKDMTTERAADILRSSHVTGIKLEDLLPELPFDPEKDPQVGRQRAESTWNIDHGFSPTGAKIDDDPNYMNVGDGRVLKTNPDGTTSWITAPGAGAAGAGKITLNQALTRVRATHYYDETPLPPDVEELLAQRMVEGLPPLNPTLIDPSDPKKLDAFRHYEQNRRARARAGAGGAAGGAEPAPASAPDTPPSTAPAGAPPAGELPGGQQDLSSEDVERAKVDPAFASWLMIKGYAPTLWRP